MKVVKMQRNSISCIICGLDNPLGLKAKFYELEDGSVASLFTYRNEHQSYPTRTHGGMITALLDELMGRVLWVKEPRTYGVTTSISVTFRKPVPLEEKLKARAFKTFDSRLGFSAKGELYSMDGTLLAEATSKFLKLNPEKLFEDEQHADDEMKYLLPIDVSEIEFPE
jgi:uncharacterized protein (TIGR00369 family)